MATCRVGALREAVEALMELLDTNPLQLPAEGPALLTAINALAPAAAEQIQQEPARWQ